MTREDLELFLERVNAASLGEYLGKVGRDEAILALEERIGWAIANHDDPAEGDIADFLARNADALKGVIDEGEAKWWERTATSPRVRKPDRSDNEAWTGIETFTTPPVAPNRGSNPVGPAPTLLPEAADTPGAAARVEPPPSETSSGETWVDDEGPVDPDSTDPIGFVAVPLSAAEKDRDSRLAATPAPLSPREHSLTFGYREVGDDEPTDPSGPRVWPPQQRKPEPAPRPAAPPARPAWQSALAVSVGSLILALGIVAMGFVVARIGSRQGRTFAEEAWRDAHVTSSTTAETPPAPEPEPVPSPEPGVVAPTPAAPPPILRDPGFVPSPLARSTWVGTGGHGPLTLHVDTQQGNIVKGRLVRVTGGLSQTTPVAGTFDAATGAIELYGEGVELTGSLSGTTLRGTWSPEGASRQWVLARQ